jgi:hypothetical protein
MALAQLEGVTALIMIDPGTLELMLGRATQ